MEQETTLKEYEEAIEDEERDQKKDRCVMLLQEISKLKKDRDEINAQVSDLEKQVEDETQEVLVKISTCKCTKEVKAKKSIKLRDVSTVFA